jgi:hypothetical protein
MLDSMRIDSWRPLLRPKEFKGDSSSSVLKCLFVLEAKWLNTGLDVWKPSIVWVFFFFLGTFKENLGQAGLFWKET